MSRPPHTTPPKKMKGKSNVIQDLSTHWDLLQDVHDSGERLGLPSGALDHTEVGPQLSEWQPLERLEHLQLALSDHPYWGRELRSFNNAPWWYRKRFDLIETGERVTLRFSNVDYYARVWLNGQYLGEHEGYSSSFSYDVTDIVREDEPNTLLVKVWSPWDDEVIAGGDAATRTHRITRHLVKGTYEHDDGLIARDVNPVGIYGTVTLDAETGLAIGIPRIAYDLDSTGRSVTVRIAVPVAGATSGRIHVLVRDASSGHEVGSTAEDFSDLGGSADAELELTASGITPWNTWDRGEPALYDIIVSAAGTSRVVRTGFRTIDIDRDPETTQLVLNGQPLYVRGTSYFPDVYVSAMSRERYLRDLLAVREAGFNLVRVHVHVEQGVFYELCDELGLAVMQDSEFNWTHPADEAWAERLVRIYLETVRELDRHPSVVTWICLNEPGVLDGDRTGGDAMAVSPGPALLKAVRAADPSRPVIKGSFCLDDPNSGDSHNYLGSLEGGADNYTVIDGSTEKLNTEYGFDAPGIAINLRREPRIYDRLRPMLDQLADIQDYQYRLIKYYTEHYRAQRGRPNWGYIQFMFIDLSPQSFYGVYDWWGMPKPSLRALRESNQPTAVILERTALEATGILLVNDTKEDFGGVQVSYTVTVDGGTTRDVVAEADLTGDAIVRVCDLDLDSDLGARVDVRLAVRCIRDGRLVAANRYDDVFRHPAHVPGHPDRMSHELGMRVYGG